MKFNHLQLRRYNAFVNLIVIILLFYSAVLFAQPSNDKCVGAILIPVAVNESACTSTSGTTLNTADGAGENAPASPCSVNFVRDDVWYKLSIPTNSNNKLITVRVEIGSQPSDMISAGIAIYNSTDCSIGALPFVCNNFNIGAEARTSFSSKCNTEILIRVWSSTGTAANWQEGQGNFRICAYLEDDLGKTPVLWGINGEGSFDGGLNGWKTGGDACTNSTPTSSLWEWRKNGDSHGPLWGGQIISSPSSCNGAMLFDSDFLDGNGTGNCLAPQQGWLESPTIDLSSFNVAGVALEFNQRVTQFLSQYFIDYSIDNGQNWQSVEINQEIEAFNTDTPSGVDPTVNETKRVNLPLAANAAQLKIRFRALANYYYWLIDDVRIVEKEAYNLAVTNFYAIAPFKLWQKNQLEDFGGLADIGSTGVKTANNVKLQLDIKDQSQNLLWSDVLEYGSLASDTVVQNLLLPGAFVHPDKDIATYTGTYTITNDSTDFDISDNSRSFNWSVTDSIMSKEDNVILGNGVRPSSSINFTWGNIYHIVNDKDDSGKKLACNYVDVGVANPDQLSGASLFVFVYKWDNADGDNTILPSELSTLGFNQVDFDGADSPNTLFRIPVLDFTSFNQGVFVEPNSDYIIAISYNAPASNPNLACFINSDGTMDYSGQELRTQLLPGQTRYSHVLDIGNTGTLALGTFVGGTVPVIRMELSNGLVSTKEPDLDLANKIVLAPNPVNDQLNINISLVAETEIAKIDILDLSGKIIITRNLKNIKNTIENFNVSSFQTGSYIMNFKTLSGSRAIKFVVIR